MAKRKLKTLDREDKRFVLRKIDEVVGRKLIDIATIEDGSDSYITLLFEDGKQLDFSVGLNYESRDNFLDDVVLYAEGD